MGWDYSTDGYREERKWFPRSRWWDVLFALCVFALAMFLGGIGAGFFHTPGL
jgi:hypothetical protein